jgi:hypothetical protein
MSIVEVQIRTDRFCELIRSEFNGRVLQSPSEDQLPDLKGKFLERIECVSCSLAKDSAGSGEVELVAELAFNYHNSLNDVRAAGSLQPSATVKKIYRFTLKFKIDFNPSLPQPPVLAYEVLALGVKPIDPGPPIPLEIPDDLEPMSAAIEADKDVVTIRIGTNAYDPVHNPPVDRTGGGEWIQLIPGDLIAEKVRRILDSALDAAVVPPAPPDPNKPWLPKPKPQELQKGKATWATWTLFPVISALGKGEIIAIDACPLFDVDISIELSLSLLIDFPDPHTMRMSAVLRWDADSTWCDIWSTVFIGVPFGILFNIAVENAASDSILGKSLAPGGGFKEVGRTDDSITFQRVEPPPPTPSRDLVRSHSEVTTEGLATGGLVSPKAVAPVLVGTVIPATPGLHIDCNLRGVSTVFNPAQVILRNAAPGYNGPPPRVFLENTVFEPANAWSIRTDVVNMADPQNTSLQTVLTFIDPPTGRLAAGTPTSVFLFTDLGVRWVDLGKIPEVPKVPPEWAKGLMEHFCGSISNPWGRGLTPLGWAVDPLLDPDYEHSFEINPVRLWTVGLRELPKSARIEFLALAPDGSERLLGIVEGKRSAALQLVTDANETLGIRSDEPFSAPAPMLLRSWMFPFAAQTFGSEPRTSASAESLLGLTGRDGTTRILEQREVGEVDMDNQRPARRSNPTGGRVVDALAREEARGREAWSTAIRLDKNTIAVTHRGQLLIGTVGTPRRVQ